MTSLQQASHSNSHMCAVNQVPAYPNHIHFKTCILSQNLSDKNITQHTPLRTPLQCFLGLN